MTTPPLPSVQEPSSLAGLAKAVEVIAQLRHPERGCPWDLKQTHASLKRYLLEESHEVLNAIDDWEQQPSKNTQASLVDELGDVLLQVLLHSQIASDDNRFTIDDVANNLAEKMIRRHPHVFGEADVANADGVVTQWEAIKAAEKTQAGSDLANSSVLGEVPLDWPALMRAAKLSKRAVKAGFAWPNTDSLWACVLSEIDEFKVETQAELVNPDRLEDEMGDILFAMVSLANHYGVDAETALARGNVKFTRRFQAMEHLATQPLNQLSFEDWDALWKQAKQSLQN